jgi:hypothetical protein
VAENNAFLDKGQDACMLSQAAENLGEDVRNHRLGTQ